MPTNKSRTKSFSKKSSTVPNKKTTFNVSAKKLTKAQSEHLRLLLTKSPSIEKLDPEIYAKLQSTIYETVEKTIPEYKKWLNSAFGESIVSEDCPVEICSSCGNDCPTPVEHIVNRVANEAINAAMTAAIRYTLEAMSKSSGKEVSEAKMRVAVKKELIKAAKEIGKGK